MLACFKGYKKERSKRASESDSNILHYFQIVATSTTLFLSPVSIKDLLYRQDCKILKAITSVDKSARLEFITKKRE